MPEYSSTTITPSDGVQVPGMNGSTSGNFLLSALRDFILASKGQANGLASLGSDGKLTASQLPDLADDVIVVASYATLPATGTVGKIYITADNNKMYRWDPDLTTPDYVELSVDLSAYATIADLQDGTLEPLISTKSRQDQNGNVIDQTYETKADASDLKSAINQIDHRVQNLEQAKGSYVVQNYKDGSVTPSGKGNWSIVEGLRGVSRVDNNLGKAINSTNWESYSSTYTNLSFADGVATVSWKASVSSGENYRYGFKQKTPYNIYEGHLYLISYEIYTSKDLRYVDESLMGSYLGPTPAPICEANKWTKIAYVVSASANNTTRTSLIYPNYNQSFVEGDYYRVRNYILTDLAVYFGTTDLSWIGSTYAERIATIQSSYSFLLLPSEYGTRIVDSSYSAVESVGFNIFDKETIKQGGYISDMGGGFLPDARCSATDYIEIIPNETYYIKTDATSGCWGAWYDADKNFISGIKYATQKLHVAPSNARYVALTVVYLNSGNVDTFCLNVSQPNTSISPHDGECLPYMTDTLTLFLTFTGKSAGSVAEMYYPETGRVTHPIGQVDLGTLNWTYSTASKKFYATLNGQKNVASSDVGNILCSSYFRTSAVNLNDDTYNMCCASINGNEVQVKNLSKTSADLVSGHASWLESVMLYYELATPDPSTFVTPILDNTLLTESGGRMATVQTGTVVDGSFDMGFINL